ncbi:hypothetical protein ACH5RR_004994 [Cinchona calisaya]|uniref:HMA domain-containing protein n=1 Tax=Cinchona calisaya TaxID=153742 RepID=A0ABD3AZJ5_9GENT
MTCTIKVSTSTPGWERTARNVLSKIHGVRAFKMDEYGFIKVSGLIHPELLIKKLAQVGKPAVLCSLQYGDCFGNFSVGPNNMPFRSTSADDHNHFYDLYGGYYDHSGAGYGYDSRPFARLANELRQRHAPPPGPPPPPPPSLGPRHGVYVPRYIHDSPGCCSFM